MNFIYYLFAGALLFIAGCGTKVDLGKSEFIGAASIGDLVSVSLNGDKFSLEGVAGKLEKKKLQGTLVRKEGFSDYVYTSPEHKDLILVVTPEIISYTLKDFGNFVVGVPQEKQSYDASHISDIYNYVSTQGYTVNYGTFRIEQNGTWQAWMKNNGANLGPEKADFFGTWRDSGQGYLIAETKGHRQKGHGVKDGIFAHLMINKNGLLIIDLVALEGIAIGAKQKEVDLSKVHNSYDILSPMENQLYAAEVAGSNVSVPHFNKNYQIQYNSPWKGFVSEPKNTLGMSFKGIVSPDQKTFIGIDRLFDLFGLAPGVMFLGIAK